MSISDFRGCFYGAISVSLNDKKIEENPGKPEYIRNVRGLGYIWNKECIKR